MLLRGKMATFPRADSHHEMTPFWEPWRCLVHPLAYNDQIAVQLPIIERAQFYLYGVSLPHYPSSKPKERDESLPRRVGIGCRKVAVADTHDEIC